MHIYIYIYDNMLGFYVFTTFQPETTTLISILIKLYRQNVSLLFNQTCLNERLLPNYTPTHTYNIIYCFLYIIVFEFQTNAVMSINYISGEVARLKSKFLPEVTVERRHYLSYGMKTKTEVNDLLIFHLQFIRILMEIHIYIINMSIK